MNEIDEAQVVTLDEIIVGGPETGGALSLKFVQGNRTSNTYFTLSSFSKAVKSLIGQGLFSCIVIVAHSACMMGYAQVRRKLKR